MKIMLMFIVAMLAGCQSGGMVQTPVRVMSFNLRYDNHGDGVNRWSERRDLVVDVIRDFNPDLLGTQECLANQATFLREHLAEYGFVGVGRDDGKLKGEMTALFYRSERFDLLDSGHFWLSQTPDVPGSKSWDAALTRMVSWVHLHDHTSDSNFWYFNTHFDHRGQQAREQSARLLRRRALEMSDTEPFIISGDFNASADGPVSALLRIGEGGEPVLIDTYRTVHSKKQNDEGTFDNFKGETSGPRIDWIIVASNVHVMDAGINRMHVGDRWPSDHFAVTATVGLPDGK